LAGLHVRGSIALRLGEDTNGTYYADFPLSIELPAAFTADPDPQFGSVTGAASLRVETRGSTTTASSSRRRTSGSAR
jgi:hypothetical protein